MQNSELSINDLDEEAQQSALTDFAHFYLQHYRTNDLEIIAQYKVDYAMNDINMYLFANQYFQPQQLAANVLRNKGNLFLAILTTINLPYNANGSLKDNPWDNWYDQQYAQIDEGK